MADEGQPVLAGVTPHLIVKGGLDAIAFYTKVFGAKLVFKQMAEDEKGVLHAARRLNEALIFLCDEFQTMDHIAAPAKPERNSVILHIGLTKPSSVNRPFAKAVKAWAEPVFPPQGMFWGDRYGQLRDPFGHVWSLGAPTGKAPKQA